MKKTAIYSVVLIFALLFCCLQSSKAQELEFQYDAAGNQVERKFVCIGCTTIYPPSLAATQPSTTYETATIEPAPQFIAYPNPVTETLNIKSESTNGTYINKIEVISSTGSILSQQKYSSIVETEQQITVSFSNKVPGLYVVRATYSDGKYQIVKIIKK